MTQPFTSAHRSSQSSFEKHENDTQDNAGQSSASPNGEHPAIVHPNFDPKKTPLDPARPLSDIPEPARQNNSQLRRLYGKSALFTPPNQATVSKWRLIGSEALAEHLALLEAAKLIELPDSFYHNHSEQPLLSALEDMHLLDMADVQQAMTHYPALNRYGFGAPSSINENKKKAKSSAVSKRDDHHDPDELLSSAYAEDWQVILQPQQFEAGVGNLATDIMACSVAVHALKQCHTRQSINQSYDAAQICEYVRSYLLSQISIAPTQRMQYRQIRLFAGHIVVAAYHLGWDIQVREDGRCHFNLSSRCGLLTRYPNLNEYYINGWSS